MKITFAGEAIPFSIPQQIAVSYTAEQATPFSDESVGIINVPLSMVEPATLDMLCKNFRDGVFASAGKVQPPVIGPGPVWPRAALQTLKDKLWLTHGKGYAFSCDCHDHEIIAGAVQELAGWFEAL